MTGVLVTLCAFDAGVGLTVFNGEVVVFTVLISEVLVVEVFVMLVVLVSVAFLLLSRCLVVLQEINARFMIIISIMCLTPTVVGNFKISRGGGGGGLLPYMG